MQAREGILAVTQQPSTYIERLKQQRIEMQDRLNKLDGAIEALEKNPGLSEVIDTLSSVGLY